MVAARRNDCNERKTMTMLISYLCLTLWGIAVIIASMVCAITTGYACGYLWRKQKLSARERIELKKCFSSIALCSVAVSTTFLFEGVGQDNFVFTKDGNLVNVIHAPRLMWQSDYDREIVGRLVFKTRQISPSDALLSVPVGSNRFMKVNLEWTYPDETNRVRIISEAIKAGIPIERDNMISSLIMLHATNQLALILEKGSKVPVSENTSTVLMEKADLMSIVLHGLGPLMDQYCVYTRDVTVSSHSW